MMLNDGVRVDPGYLRLTARVAQRCLLLLLYVFLKRTFASMDAPADGEGGDFSLLHRAVDTSRITVPPP